MRFLLLSMFAGAGFAQIAGPQLGLVGDGAAVRPVAGIPASAVVGDPIVLSTKFSRVAAAGAFALAVDASTGAVNLVTSDGKAAALDGVRANPDRIVFSAHATAAVLWFAADRRAQIVSGIAESPAVHELALDADPVALAVSDDGLYIAASWSDRAFRFGVNGELTALNVVDTVLALAFQGSDLALITATEARLTKDSTRVAFAAAVKPVAAAFNSNTLVIADTSGILLTIDLASREISTLDCACAPEGLVPMTRGVYRLTAFDGGAFKLLDTSQNAIWFAPVAFGGAQ